MCSAQHCLVVMLPVKPPVPFLPLLDSPRQAANSPRAASLSPRAIFPSYGAPHPADRASSISFPVPPSAPQPIPTPSRSRGSALSPRPERSVSVSSSENHHQPSPSLPAILPLSTTPSLLPWGNARATEFTRGFISGGSDGQPLQQCRYRDNGLHKLVILDQLKPLSIAREQLRRERREHFAKRAEIAEQHKLDHKKVCDEHRNLVKLYRRRQVKELHAAQVSSRCTLRPQRFLISRRIPRTVVADYLAKASGGARQEKESHHRPTTRDSCGEDSKVRAGPFYAQVW